MKRLARSPSMVVMSSFISHPVRRRTTVPSPRGARPGADEGPEARVRALVRWRLQLALAGGLAAAGYGALKLAWAAGSGIGSNGPPPWETGAGAFGGMSSFERFLAFEGTALLAFLAAGILAALVKPPAQAITRRVLRILAWAGAAVMLVPGVWGSVTVSGALLGMGNAEEPLELWVFGFVYGCFLVLGLAFAGLAWLTRSDGA
jgi:hypothetical protein